MDFTISEKMKLKCAKEELVGNTYQHFKGGIYVVDGVALDTSTCEVLVIYHEYRDTDNCWARPYSEFVSPVDKEKYPNVTQNMRFNKL